MSGTITVQNSPTACYVDASGIHAPSYQTILDYVIGKFQSIYGGDSYLGNDSQDYQMLAVFALAISDSNAAAVAAYNSFSPATAQGAGLSRMVKINGIRRLIPTNSTVDLVVVGQAQSTITGGIATDELNQRWFLPSPITIPITGQITVTATAENSGAVIAPAGSVTTISTPARGWQSVNNPSDAVVGQPVELDGALRQRQAVSTELPSLSVLDGIVGAIYQLPGVTRVQPYENKTKITDANGIPGNTISLVVEGGDAAAIGRMILLKKTPGTGTYGTTVVTAYDAYGNPNQISFFRPTDVPITVAITVSPLIGYTTVVAAQIIAAIVARINALPIGADVIQTYQYAVAYSIGSATFTITSVVMSRSAAPPAATNITIAFNEAATATTSSVTVTVG